MTNRARILIVSAMGGLLLGILRYQPTLSLVSLAVLIWVFSAWCSLMVKARVMWPIVSCDRTLNGRTLHQPVLWADRPLRVEVMISSTGRRIPPLTTFRDVLPDTFQPLSGNSSVSVCSGADSVLLKYECCIRAAGRVAFPGIHVRLSDPAGLFVVERLIREDRSYRVYPTFVSVGDMRPGVKRINSLPQHGVHRLQRSGFGSELLELREYQPGDPPKAIAWKVSARRDRLMTRQYESEVPVRVNLLIDGFASSRAGGFGKRLLDQSLFTGASIARACVSIGDPIAAVLMDESGSKRLPAGTGERAFYRLLEAMSDFAEHNTLPQISLTPGLMASALAVCRERYPELLDDRINQPPFTWLPLRPKKRRDRYQRSLLANVLAELFGLSLFDIIRMVHDDRMMGTVSCRFLQNSGLAWVTMPSGRNTGTGDRSNSRLRAVSQQLTKSVARARDNEVFVILADLISSADSLEEMMPAVKMAMGRHHRVVFISPTPTGLRPGDEFPSAPIENAADVFRRAEHLRTVEFASRVRRQLRRTGASVAFAGPPRATAIVLAEAELAGRGRSVAGRSR
ncbi:MAG: DUF58 domain-containing protein [Planctomycetaceae bacterium]